MLPSKGIAALLAIFFGGLGIHQFYLKRYNIGVIFLLLAVFSFGFLLPVLAIIGFFQGISYLFYSQENWARTVQKQ